MGAAWTRSEGIPGRPWYGVSWGALLAGALFIIASTTMVWLLGLGVTLVAINPSQIRGGMITLVIIAIVATLIGAALGGLLAGWLQGTGRRRLGALHGLLSCALAFLIATGFWIGLSRSVLGGAAGTLSTTAQTAVSATAEAAGGASAAGGGNVASGAQRFLEGLGYSAPEARDMVKGAQGAIQRTLRGHGRVTGTNVAGAASSAAGTFITLLGGAIWIYWATWLAAMLLALFFGALGATRSLVEPEPARERDRIRSPSEREPLTTPPYQPTGV